MALKIREITRADVRIIHKPPLKGDIRRSVADISRMKRIIGFTPRTSLEDGLSSFIKYASSGL